MHVESSHKLQRSFHFSRARLKSNDKVLHAAKPSSEAHLDHGELQGLVVVCERIPCKLLQLGRHHHIEWQQNTEVPRLRNHLDVIRFASSAGALQQFQVAVVDTLVQQIGAKLVGGFWRTQISSHFLQGRDAASTQSTSDSSQLVLLQEVRQFSTHTFHGSRKTRSARDGVFLIKATRQRNIILTMEKSRQHSSHQCS